MARVHRNRRQLNATVIKLGHKRTSKSDILQPSEARFRTDNVLRKYLQDRYEYKIDRNNKRALVITEHLPASYDFKPESGMSKTCKNK